MTAPPGSHFMAFSGVEGFALPRKSTGAKPVTQKLMGKLIRRKCRLAYSDSITTASKAAKKTKLRRRRKGYIKLENRAAIITI